MKESAVDRSTVVLPGCIFDPLPHLFSPGLPPRVVLITCLRSADK